MKQLSLLWPQKTKSDTRHLNSSQHLQLPNPDAVECKKATADVAAVVVGTALNLIICATESDSSTGYADELRQLATAFATLDEWLA